MNWEQQVGWWCQREGCKWHKPFDPAQAWTDWGVLGGGKRVHRYELELNEAVPTPETIIQKVVVTSYLYSGAGRYFLLCEAHKQEMSDYKKCNPIRSAHHPA